WVNRKASTSRPASTTFCSPATSSAPTSSSPTVPPPSSCNVTATSSTTSKAAAFSSPTHAAMASTAPSRSPTATSSLGGSIVWRTPFLRWANWRKYAAVLRPDGVVAIYGPALAVASDDYYKNLWSSNNASSIGDYALLLQINGQAVVYGPTVWLTTSSPKSLLDTTSSSPEPPIAT
ncbi:unnamed protein product, partial [Musa banksii]